MDNIMNLEIYQLVAAYVFVLILMLIVKIKGIPREKEIIISSIRMTLQLILIGYILVYVFDNPSPWYALVILFVVEVFSIFNIIKRTK